MTTHSPKPIVLLGLMTRMPVAGNVWLIVQYLVGFRRLGFDPYYVEAHGVYPGMLMGRGGGDAGEAAAAFVDAALRPFGFADKWAVQDLHAGGRCHGLSNTRLRELYRSAELVINVHGGTQPLPEHSATGRLVYLGTDPVVTEVELHQGRRETIDFLAPHAAFFTWGENYGNPDCRVPWSDRFRFKPTRAPVVTDFWAGLGGPGRAFTTVGNWDQTRRRKDVVLDGERYTWSKHHEFVKFLDLPARTGQAFELALSGGSYTEADRRMLEGKGWAVRDSLTFSTDLDEYRRYVGGSRGEFTAAKDQNVRLRSGWFSERSAQYLAAGRPVVTQETGFGNVLPTGEGLFGFSTLDEAAAAVEVVNADYARHRRAAAELAREQFGYDTVLTRFLDDLGVRAGAARRFPVGEPAGEEAPSPFPDSLVLAPVSRWPTRLPAETEGAVLGAPIPAAPRRGEPAPDVSIVVVTHNGLLFTRLCLESLLTTTPAPAFEVIVADNGSTDGTPEYLAELARRWPNVRAVFNGENLGFAAANNRALELARGAVLVLLNNDTIPTHGWLDGLLRHLADPAVGLVGPVTNRAGNEAQVETAYRTLGECRRFAAGQAAARAGRRFDIRMLAMYCAAMRREVFAAVGPLDERFEVGLFEDDDYAVRVRAAGYRVVCAEDVFVHHFGQASIGALEAGAYGRLFHANRRRWEAKWAVPWQPYERRRTPGYDQLIGRAREAVDTALPPDAAVLVVSRGDDQLLDLNGRRAGHFPQAADGVYAGHHPADSAEAVAHLEALRAGGGQYLLIPEPAFWWLDHYAGFAAHLREHHTLVLDDPACRVVRLDAPRTGHPGARLAPVGGAT
jgi:GT2 family glycosyltransferase